MKLFFKHSLFVISLGFLLLFNQNSTAQDQRYSQYYSAPARVNPALVGIFDGAYRVGINYRTQWGANMTKGYNSGSLTADGKITVSKDDYVGLGFNAMYDVAGVADYSTTEIGIDFNYQKKLYQGKGAIGKHYSQYLAAGGHLGFGQRAINWEKLTYAQQWDSEYQDGYYNPGLTSGEELRNVRQNRGYADLHAGLVWYGTFGKRRGAFGGFSISHLSRPDISLYTSAGIDSTSGTRSSQVERLPMRFTIHGGGEIQVGGRKSPISLLPGIVMMFQGPSTEINTGIGIKYQAPSNDNLALRFGLWSRIVNQYVSIDASTMGMDALVIHLGIDYNQFKFGFSYDATVSKLSAINNTRGSFEFALFYIFPGNFKRMMGCPSLAN